MYYEVANQSMNCDLYHDLFQLLYKKAIKLYVRWMRSHLKPTDKRPEGVFELDVLGSKHADDFANKAAKSVEVPLNVVKLLVT